uniref:protein-tyrosine-phosphatase n=1 Tax=Geotrypetes seraphini TaxID=260995 RepID=A0A6P8SLS1_GEOSA|nr:LOW QUALITY PROTEIN: receptor-type tyrosine-protein phosphatase H [Geotrypetes seraphini]
MNPLHQHFGQWKSAFLLSLVSMLWQGGCVHSVPDPVSSVKVDNKNETSVSLSWTAPNDTSNDSYTYRIMVNSSSGFLKNESTSSASTSWIVKGLDPGVSYTFTIYTVTIEGVQSTSAFANATTVPDPVPGVKVDNKNETSVSLFWTAPNDTSNDSYTYRIIVNSSSGFLKNESTSSASTSWIVTGLNPGVSYTFTIYTVTSDGVESTMSASANATTVPDPVPGVKVDKKNKTSVSLFWTAPNDTSNDSYTYRIIVNSSSGFLKNESTSSASTSWIVTGLNPGVLYTFTIYTVTSDGVESTMSASASVTTVPDPVSSVKVDNKNEMSVSLSWTAPNDTSNDSYTYRIMVSSSSGFLKNESTSSASTSWIVTGLNPGVLYTFTIYTVTSDGEESTGASANATTVPNPVSDVKVDNKNETSVSLSWTAPNDTSNDSYTYRIMVSSSSGFLKNESTSSASTSWIVTGLNPGVLYTFTIYTVTSDGEESTGASANATTVPIPVLDVKVDNKNETSVSLSWTAPNDTSNDFYTYRIMVSSSSGFLKNESTSSANTSWIVTGLNPGVSYTFTIYTVTSDGVESTMSASANATTVPYPVSGVKVDNKNETSVSLFWTAPNVTSNDSYTYRIMVTSSSGLPKNKSTSSASTSWIVTGLAPGVSYTFTIYTVTIDGVESTRNASVTATTLPNSPQNLTEVTVSASEILLSWLAPYDFNREFYSYTVTWESKSANVSQKQMNFTISSLDPGTLYNVSVSSVIEAVSSVPAYIWAQTAPQTPGSLKISNSTNTSVFISWELASGNVNQLSGFQVMVTNTSDETVVKTDNIMDPSARNWTLRNLTPGTNYTVKFRSFKTSAPGASPAARGEGHLRRERNTLNTIETFSPFLIQMILTDPGTVQVLSCSQRNGAYSLRVFWNLPKGFVTQVWILVNKERHVSVGTTETEVEVKGLQPAALYTISMETVAYGKKAESDSITCYTDNTGVIVGSIFGVLLFLLLVACLVFLVLWRRRNKKEPGISPVTMTNIPSTIRVQDFPDYFQQQAADSDFGFADQYQYLASVGTTQSRTAAEQTVNRTKNRYNNVLPYDHSRVRLQYIGNDPSTDYINANYVLGYNSDKEFIATQGPLPDTMGDFWRMVWEQRVGTLVMLTNCTEGSKVKCAHYWPLDYTPCTYEDIMVTIINETILPEWTIRDFHLKHAREGSVRSVRHFHYTVWPDFGVPHNTDTVIRFRDLVREYIDQRRGDGPTVVHCSAGVGRTGTLIALDYLMQQMEKERRIGVYSFVKQMRMSRCLMIQTESQYIFLNKCILDLIQQPPENIYENTMNSLIYENASAIRDLEQAA